MIKLEELDNILDRCEMVTSRDGPNSMHKYLGNIVSLQILLNWLVCWNNAKHIVYCRIFADCRIYSSHQVVKYINLQFVSSICKFNGHNLTVLVHVYCFDLHHYQTQTHMQTL